MPLVELAVAKSYSTNIYCSHLRVALQVQNPCQRKTYNDLTSLLNLSSIYIYTVYIYWISLDRLLRLSPVLSPVELHLVLRSVVLRELKC